MKASPAGIEPTLRDPQSRGLSVSLRGQHGYFSTNFCYTDCSWNGLSISIHFLLTSSNLIKLLIGRKI